jgi:hypothetical protein
LDDHLMKVETIFIFFQVKINVSGIRTCSLTRIIPFRGSVFRALVNTPHKITIRHDLAACKLSWLFRLN